MSSRALLRDAPGIGHHRAPEPTDLAVHPEIAILAALDNALETAAVAIVAANPELRDDPFEGACNDHGTTPPRLYAADAVLYVTHALRCAIDRYRCAIRDEPMS